MITSIQLSEQDIDFFRAQLTLAGNLPLLPVDPTGIRDVSGIANNVFNPTWGAADQFFPRMTTATYGEAQGTFTMGALGRIEVDMTPTSYAVRGVNLVDASPRLISNLVSSQNGLTTLQVQDDPQNPAGARLSPLTGTTNPLPYSGFMTLVGQFFDHGLDFVHKGQDGVVLIPLLPGDPLYVEGSNFNFMMASRTNTLNGESINTISPFIDLSQSYGSAPSHTVFLREYDASGQTTGRLVSGNGGPQSGPLDGMATWADIKANAARIGIILHDLDINEIPAVRLNSDGTAWRDANGKAWLVAVGPDGATYYVQDSHLASNTRVLQLDEETGATIELTDATFPTLQQALGEIQLLGIGHAFLDDMAHGTGPNAKNTNAVGDMLDTPITEYFDNGQIRYQGTLSDLVNRHFIAGDGRANENIGLTAIHDVFHSEHNRMLIDIKAMVLGGVDTHGNTWTARADAAQWTNEQFFQAAKLVTEMEYQHMIFGEFVRKFSPNINAFAGYDVSIDASITAEFAHAVYRFGHSMLTETVDMKAFGADGKATGQDLSMLLFDAFLNPTAYDHTTAGEVALGMSVQVGNAIDEWVTDALRNNLVGLPLDLATLNMVRGRDAGVPSLNQTRAQLFEQTGLTTLRPYTSWDSFGLNLLHPDSLKNFVMAYARDAILTQFGGNADLAYWGGLQMSNPTAYAAALSAAAEAALNNTAFMTGGNQDFNNIDLWLGGLAERKVAGGMLGSTFDFIFATQMIKLQNGDRFYYLDRLAGTDLLAEIEGQLMSDIVMRNTGVRHLYSDIFSVPDAVVEMSDSHPTFATATQLMNGNRAGWYQGTFYGNAGNYTDARGVANPNLRGNASEVIGGTDNAESINGMGGNDTIWGDGGNDTVEGGEGNDFLHGGGGNDNLQDSMGDDLLWGDDGDDLVNGGIGIDQVFGGAGNDRVYGGDGADVIDGGAGNDVIYGDNGAIVDGQMDPNGDSDLIAGGTGNDTLYGGGGADALDGGVGDDVLVGGSGADALIGLDGNDLFIMDAGDTGFNQTVDGGLGIDTVDYSASKGRGAALNGRPMGVDINLSNLGPAVAPVGINAPDAFLAVERAIGSAFDDYIIGGNAVVTDALGNPVLRRDANGNPIPVIDPVTGQPQVDPLTGLVVFQTVPMEWDLAGGAGNDVLGGGVGNDRFDGGTGQDIVSYANATAGVRINLGTTTAQNTLGAGTDTLISIEGVIGSAFSDTLIGTGSANVIDGGAGLVSDTLQAGGGNDIVSFLSSGAGVTVTLGLTVSQDTIGAGIDLITGFENIIGSSFDDTLNGDGNNNTFEGGQGNDVINGNGGTDTAIYGNAFAAVTVSLATTAAQNTGGAGIDTLTSIENLVGSGYGDTLTGNANANNISAGFGADVVNGGGGNDTLTGGLGDDIIDGGAGTDTAVFSGNRSAYSFTSSRSGTFTYLFVSGPDGTDRLVNVEQLQFADGLVAAPVILTTGADVYTGTTNGDTILALAGADTINGGAGNDVIEGGDDNDTLNGDAGDDTVTGGRGNDLINGGLGTDTAVYSGNRAWYLVATDANTGVTTVTDTRALGEGIDTLNSVERIRFADVTLSTPVLLTAAADTYTGTATDDVVYALAGNDSLVGGAGNDSLYGGVGNDTLDGGTGADLVAGGGGDDTLVVDNAADVVVENAAEGTDTVRASVTVAALADNVENLVLTGSAALDGTGNALNNVLTGNTGNNVLKGGLGNDTISGGAGVDTAVFSGQRASYSIVVNVAAANFTVSGADGVDTVTGIENLRFDDGVVSAPVLLSVNADNWNGTAQDEEVYGLAGSDNMNGNDGADRLMGNDGNDTLNGGNGDDVLWGGAGDDTLTGGAGIDTAVYSDATAAVIVSLATTNRQQTGGAARDMLSGIENLVGSAFNDTLTGDANANMLQGGAGNDSLNGGAGNDVLAGGLGNDTLVGGTGLDVFLFDTTPNGTTNRDTVNGFVVADDTIQLSQAVFSALGLGTLGAAAFNTGTQATDADDRILFDAATGALFYDADGVGGAAAVQFATLTNITGVVSAADFVVVG